MKRLADVTLSVLDVSPVREGGTAAEAPANTLDLARHAELWGYHRYWVAEHHNNPGIASAATAVVIGQVAGGTVYPGRIDLGLGRAPGGDQRTAYALRRTLGGSADTFPQDVQELQAYFRPAAPGQAVRAIPGEGLGVPLWLLGSSDFSARLAAELGLPFAFASHFAPDYLHAALDLYRTRFKPSESLVEPHVMLGINAFAADTDDEARRLFTSLQQAFLNLVRGGPGQLAPPVECMEGRWSPAERAHVEQMTRVSVIGSPRDGGPGFQALVDATGADELMLTAPIFDHPARLPSFEIVAGIRG